MSESVVHFKMPFPLVYTKAVLTVETPDGNYSVEVYRGKDAEVEVKVEQDPIYVYPSADDSPIRPANQPQKIELTFRAEMVPSQDEANLGKLWSFAVPEDAVPQGTFLP